jgi:hypothetical protein
MPILLYMHITHPPLLFSLFLLLYRSAVLLRLLGHRSFLNDGNTVLLRLLQYVQARDRRARVN